MFNCFFPDEYLDSTYVINFDDLYAQGYRGLLFDIDNTLVHHGDSSTSEIADLFRRIQGIGLKTILLSNNDRERTEKSAY